MLSFTVHPKLMLKWDWEWFLLTQMIVGTALGVEPHHVEDPISSLAPCDFGTCILVTLITGAIVEIISLGFGTITWFPSFVAHDS